MNLATQILLFGKPFRIADYFRMGQIGWHWQFDDPLKRVGIPYEWTDTAGTTPVTAVGQGIGLLLGREYGGATGPSLLANGATGLTGTATAASYNTSTFAGSVSRAGDASNQSWVTWTGLTTSAVYRLRITNTGATSLDVRNGGVAGTIVASIAAGASTWVHPATTGGSTSITITATNNSTTATFTLGQFAVLPGTHLTQATGTAKPTLSARVNALLNTETLGGTGWTANGGGTSLSGQTAPDGTSTAVRITSTAVFNSGYNQGSLTPHGGQQREGIWLRGVSGGEAVSFGDATNRTNVVLTTSWAYYTGTVTKASAFFVVYATGTVAQSWFAWHPDSRTADDAAKNIPAYQRVGATAADHDTDGFPHFIEGDGTDNCMASVSTVDGSAHNKISIVTAVTKNSDAAAGLVLEHTTNTSTVDGAFYVGAPASAAAHFAFATRGTLQAAVRYATTYAAPITGVLTSAYDNAASGTANQVVPLVNGATPGAVSDVLGPTTTGNFANATLYVLSRAGTSLRFNGRFYGSTGRFGPMGDSERNNLTRWWQKRIGTA